MKLNDPYVLLIGAATNPAFAKTALGLLQWAPEKCLAQVTLPGCQVILDLPEKTVTEAKNAGAKSLVLGCAPVGGGIEASWVPIILDAMAAGMDIVSGLHIRLESLPELAEAAARANVRLLNVRVPPSDIPVANGRKRTGKRLLTVGTDCAVGKKYTALALAREMQQQGLNADFQATGQTGIMIAGRGIPIDAVVSDFVAGAAEQLSPDNTADHWDVIEGQGSLFHPAYAGVSLGLLHGSQADALVLCHDAGRQGINGFDGYPIPDINACISHTLASARLTNPGARFVGVSVNTSTLAAGEREACLEQLRQKTHLPCVDPLVEGVAAIVNRL